MTEYEQLDYVALVLVVVGALNWGLVGAANLDLVQMTVGQVSGLAARVVYGLVGLAGLYTVYYLVEEMQ